MEGDGPVAVALVFDRTQRPSGVKLDTLFTADRARQT
jgi:hypothetical protein